MLRLTLCALAGVLSGGCGLVLDTSPAPMQTDGAAADSRTGSADAGSPDAGSPDAAPPGDAGTSDASAPDAGDDASLPACDRYVVSGADGSGLGPEDPVGAIQAAIESMAGAGATGVVCVAARLNDSAACAPTTYAEAVVMHEGVSVVGGFHSGSWDRLDPACVTTIAAPVDLGVHFPHGLSPATRLEGFTVLGQDGEVSHAITMEGAGTVVGNEVRGGRASSSSIGIAILSAPGATIRRNRLIAGGAAPDSAGIFASGDLTAVVVSGNRDIRGGGGGTRSIGVRLDDCGGGEATLAANNLIEGASSGGGMAIGVLSFYCDVRIERNTAVLGRSGGVGDADAIHCASGGRCTVEENRAVVGIHGSGGGRIGRGIVLLNGATGSAVRNREVSGCTASAEICTGVMVRDAGDGTLVDANVVLENAAVSWNSGIHVARTDALVTNNLVFVDGGHGIDLNIAPPPSGSTEAVVHSNTVVAPPGRTSTRATRLLVTEFEAPAGTAGAPNGVFRNNVAACVESGASAVAFTEFGASSAPRIFEHNDLYGCSRLYESNGYGHDLAWVDSSRGSGNLSVEPGFVSATDYHLDGSSPLIDAGTSSGSLPPKDFDGDDRPRGDAPDIGFDEAG